MQRADSVHPANTPIRPSPASPCSPQTNNCWAVLYVYLHTGTNTQNNNNTKKNSRQAPQVHEETTTKNPVLTSSRRVNPVGASVYLLIIVRIPGRSRVISDLQKRWKISQRPHIRKQPNKFAQDQKTNDDIYNYAKGANDTTVDLPPTLGVDETGMPCSAAYANRSPRP